jgi:hypothetical protein
MANTPEDAYERVLRDFFQRLERFNTSSSGFSGVNADRGAAVDFEGLNKGFDDLSTSTSKLRGSQAELTQSMRYSRSVLKDTFLGHIFGSSKALGKLEDSLKDGAAGVEKLEREVKAAGEAVQKLEEANTKLGAAATAEDKARLAAARRRLETARSEHDASKEIHTGLTNRFQRMSHVTDGLSKTMSQSSAIIGKAVDSVMTVTDNLLKSENAIAFGTSTLQTSVSLAAEGLKTFGSVVNTAGDVMLTAPNPYVKAAGAVAKLGAWVTDFIAGQSERVNKGLQILGDELQKTANSYHTLSTVGATFAGGMEEMRSLSQSAAMGLSEFTKIVQNNADTFAQAGLGMTSAAKRFASISKSMSESGLREQITNLGYSFEEMGGLTADVMAQLKSTGQLGYKSDQEIGQLTADYAKNLRLISDITGQDARKKMEAARNESLKAGVFEKVMRQGGPEAVAKLQQQLATMPDVMKKGYLEFVASGGTAIRDMGMNIGMQQNKEILPYLQQQYGDLNDRSVDLDAATERTLRGAARVGQGAQQVTQLGESLGVAQVFGATGEGVTAGAEFGSGLRQQTQRYSSPEEVDAAIKRARQLREDPSKLNKEVSKGAEQLQRAKAQIEGVADKALPGFAKMIGNTTETVEEFSEALKSATKVVGADEEDTKSGGPGVFARMKSWFSSSDKDKKADEKPATQEQNTKKQEKPAEPENKRSIFDGIKSVFQDQNTKKQEKPAEPKNTNDIIRSSIQDQTVPRGETTTKGLAAILKEQNEKTQETPAEPENKRSIVDGIKSVFQDQNDKKQEKPAETENKRSIFDGIKSVFQDQNDKKQEKPIEPKNINERQTINDIIRSSIQDQIVPRSEATDKGLAAILKEQNEKKQEKPAEPENKRSIVDGIKSVFQDQNDKKQEKPAEPENKRSIVDGIKSVFQDQNDKKQEKPVEPPPTTFAVNPNDKRPLQGQEKIDALERQKKRLEEAGPRTSTQQSRESHQEMLKTLDTAIAAEKAKANASSTIRESKSEIRIAGEPVIPGQLLSSRQMDVMKMSMDSGNDYPADLMAQYRRQLNSAPKNPVEDSTSIDLSGKPKKALGGITSGVSIAGERGPEAVVPLPNGRTIPVDIQSTDINYGGVKKAGVDPIAQMMTSLEAFFKNQVSTMQKDSDNMENILRVLQDSYSTQDKLLANSY